MKKTLRGMTVLFVLALAVHLFYGCGPSNKERLQQALNNCQQNGMTYSDFRLSDISARQITSEEKLAEFKDKLVMFKAMYIGRAPTQWNDGEYTVHLVTEAPGAPFVRVEFPEKSSEPLYGENWRTLGGRPMTIWAIIQYTPPPSFWEQLGGAALSGAASGTQQGLNKGLAQQGRQLNPELSKSLSNISTAAGAMASAEYGVVEFYVQKYELGQKQ